MVPILDLKNARLNTRFQVSPVQTLMSSLALVAKPFISTRGCYKKKPCSHCNGRHASLMHSDSSEDKHEQPTPENASQQPARGREKEIKNRSQRDVNKKSLLTDESSGVERVCNLTNTEGPATALPIVPVKVRAQGSPFCIETYALLDTGSNSTFCFSMLLDRLGVKGKHLKLKLT